MRVSSHYFSKAARCSSSQHKMLSKRPIRLVLDFDGTLTKNDTIAQLAWAGYNSNKNTASQATWSAVSDAYVADLKAHTASYNPGKEERRTITQELAWLESLAAVEKASFNRGQRRGLFENIKEDDIDHAARQLVHSGNIVFRDGWLDLIKEIGSRRANGSIVFPVDILSVSWSRRWLRSCMAEGAEQQGCVEDMKAIFQNGLQIHANEICEFGSSHEANDIQTSKDKVRTLSKKILKLSTIPNDPERELLVYIGDSSTDLGCLISADIGCCMLDEPPGSGQKELQETLHRLGVIVDDLANFSSKDALDLSQQDGSQMQRIDVYQQLNAPESNKIWRVKNFQEVRHWLLAWATSSG